MKKLFSSASSSSKQIVREGLKPLRNAQELKKSHVYDETHNILVVGEDNFNFSKKLKEVVGSANSIYATSAHELSAPDVVKNTGSYDNKASLRHVFYNINPMKIASNEDVRGKDKDRVYDRVVCYDPKDEVAFGKFLRSCRDFISEKGEVHIFCNSKGPQFNWELEKIAAEHGYILNQGMITPWDGAKKDHHFAVLPFSRDPNFKEKKEYTYHGKDFDWEAFALQQQAEYEEAEAALQKQAEAEEADDEEEE